MRYSIQLQKMIKRPMMLGVVAAIAAGCSDTEADSITQHAQPSGDTQFQSRIVEIQMADNSSNPSSNESHSDSNMAAKNWNNTNGPDTHAVAPSNDVGMAAEKWRSLEQTVIYSDSNMAAKNWNNPNGPDTHAVAPSNDVGMAAEKWRSLEQVVTHSDSNMAAKNWNNPNGPDQYNVEPSDKDSMAAENWREIR